MTSNVHDRPDLMHSEAPPETAHDVVWTPDRIKAFWDYNSSNSALEDTYFSKMRGRSIVDFVSRRIRIGSALDMGCGRGDLIGYLLEKHEAMGTDQSPESIAEVNRRFQRHPRFRGAFAGSEDLPDGVADTVFVIEVVEHLDDATLASLLTEARRLLNRDGHLVLTTPNEEELEANKVLCPECRCVFHRWQHVRSWTAQGLVDHLAQFGFEGTAMATLLSHRNGLGRIAHKLYHRLKGAHMPNMVYIGSPR